MSAFFGDVAASWMNIVTFGIIDYVMDKFVQSPLNGLGMVGAYGGGGLAFQAKLSAANANPLSALRGSFMR